MRKLGILLGLLVGILVFQGASFAQTDRIPEIHPLYFVTYYIDSTGLFWDDGNFFYTIIYRQNTTIGWIYFDLVTYDKANRMLHDVRTLGSVGSGRYYTQYYVKGCAFRYYENQSDFIAWCWIGNESFTEFMEITPTQVTTLSYIYENRELKGVANPQDYTGTRYRFLPTDYRVGGTSLKIWDGDWFELYVPTPITQIFEAWGFFDVQAQKYFVFVIANHQSYPGYHYLYVLRYDSNRNYETTKVMLNTFEVAYMIPYVRDLGNYRLILYDYTNNRYLDYEWETYENGDIAFVSMETYYSYFIPKTKIYTDSVSGASKRTYKAVNVHGVGQLPFILECTGNGYCELEYVRAYCLNGTMINKTVNYGWHTWERPETFFFFDFGCEFNKTDYRVYMYAGPYETIHTTTYIGFHPQENLGRTKKNIFLFEPDVYNYGNTIFASYQPKTLTLDVEPEVGDSETPFNITVTQQNLVTPYDLSIYVKTPQDTDYWLWFTVEDYTGDTYQTTFMGGQTLGDYCFYAVAVDSEGSTVQSNIDCMTINETISPLTPFNISVYPTVGTRDTIFQFNTTNISGGVPPYYVYVTTNESADKILVCTLDAPGKCVGTFKHKYSVFGVGWANVIGLVYDSRGFWTRSLNSVPVYFNVPEPGPPLNVTLTISPETGNDETIFLLCLNISGGLPPYTVNWYDKTIPMCTNEQYNFSAPFEICERVMFYPGDHSVYAIVTSDDEQSATSNTVSVSVEYSSGRNYNVWMDCIGELGEGVYGGVTYPGPPAPPKYNLTQPLAGINVTLLEQSGYGWIVPFLTPAFIVVAAIVGVGAVVEYYIRSGGVGFALTVMFLSLILWYLGFFPASVAILITVLCGLFLWYLFSRMGGG